MTHAPACYQDVDDVLDLSYVPNTSEVIDVNDLLDLSYVPSTAEDIVLLKEKQKYMYSLVQASSRKYKCPDAPGVQRGSTVKVDLNYNQSVAPDGPSMPPPIRKETWVAGKQEGGASRQAVRRTGS
jgi:hypothetical protein